MMSCGDSKENMQVRSQGKHKKKMNEQLAGQLDGKLGSYLGLQCMQFC